MGYYVNETSNQADLNKMETIREEENTYYESKTKNKHLSDLYIG
jgi:hypothetical protein